MNPVRNKKSEIFADTPKASRISNGMKILAIETSCDETSIAVLEAKNNKIKILSNVVSSQVKIHAPYGGVVPGLAAREHEKNLMPGFEKALKEAKMKMAEIDFIAITQGPGLEIALWKGINFAKELARFWNKPLIPVNHLEGHIYSNWLPPKNVSSFKFQVSRIFPALNLIVSGGHTQLVLMTGHGKFKIIGETVDDAAGEAFDKVAKMTGLGYPGGPVVSARADEIQITKSKLQINSKSQIPKIKFPRPMINSKNYNLSFSGLKTAVLYKLKELEKNKIKLTENLINRICYEFQKAVIDVLVLKTIRAAKEYKVKSILLSGGVSANKLLRKTLEKESKRHKLFYSQPDFQYTGDNAAMIALAAYYKIKNKELKTKIEKLAAEPNLRIKNW